MWPFGKNEEKIHGTRKRRLILKSLDDKIADAQLELAKINGKRADMYQKVLNEAVELTELGYDAGMKINRDYSGNILEVLTEGIDSMDLPRPIKGAIKSYVKSHPELGAVIEGFINDKIEQATKGLTNEKIKGGA